MKNTKEEISRKKALKKLGKYAGLTAIGTILLLTPNESALLAVLLHQGRVGNKFI